MPETEGLSHYTRLQVIVTYAVLPALTLASFADSFLKNMGGGESLGAYNTSTH